MSCDDPALSDKSSFPLTFTPVGLPLGMPSPRVRVPGPKHVETMCQGPGVPGQ